MSLPRLLLGALAAVFLAACDDPVFEAPAQPIAYSHKAHLDAGLTCTRCHRGAKRVREAGLPEMAACISCHRRRIPDHPEIVKFKELYELGQPLQWRRVNVLPSSAMVHFHHGAHARADVDCDVCHGDVSQMTLAHKVVETADMSWCVDCHESHSASTDCLTCHH